MKRFAHEIHETNEIIIFFFFIIFVYFVGRKSYIELMFCNVSMSLKAQQDFSARLFTDESLCRNFLCEPEKIGLENNLTNEDIAILRSVLPEQLKLFSDSLFYKRLHEIENLLPLTKELLGKSFADEFREFSKTYNPKTVKKHLEDAVKFADCLIKNESFEKSDNEIIKFEKIKLEFFGFQKRFCWGIFSYDLETKRRRTFKKLRVWLRIGRREIIL